MKVFTEKGIAVEIDEEDLELFEKYTWYVSPKGYLMRNTSYRKDGKICGKALFFHREVIIAHGGDLKDGYVDHKDRNKLNNQKENLRYPVTKAENMRNREQQKNNLYGYKGIYFHKNRRCPWAARIACDGKQIFIGWYLTPEEAALAYNEAAKKYFGEFAYLNEVAEIPKVAVPHQTARSDNTSGYKGVSRNNNKTGKFWTAKITYNKKTHSLGNFETPEEAALAYNKKSIELFGDKAFINVIPEEKTA